MELPKLIVRGVPMEEPSRERDISVVRELVGLGTELGRFAARRIEILEQQLFEEHHERRRTRK